MKQNLLSAAKVKSIVNGKHHDGRGLYLVGSEQYRTFSWTLRIYKNTVTGKPRDYGIGPIADYSLEQARKVARDIRELAASGTDPVEERRAKVATAREEAAGRVAGRVLFRDAAREFLKVHGPTWKNGKHRQQWANTLKDYAFPKLGSLPIEAISAALINEALAPIWQAKAETASRVKQRIERVIQWIRDGRPLPKKGASKRVKHHKAMPFVEMPAFMAELRERDSISARALEFTILTAARTSETISSAGAAKQSFAIFQCRIARSDTNIVSRGKNWHVVRSLL